MMPTSWLTAAFVAALLYPLGASAENNLPPPDQLARPALRTTHVAKGATMLTSPYFVLTNEGRANDNTVNLRVTNRGPAGSVPESLETVDVGVAYEFSELLVALDDKGDAHAQALIHRIVVLKINADESIEVIINSQGEGAR